MILIYKLIGKNDLWNGNGLKTILENRGIEDMERFLNPSADDVIHYSKLKNMNEAVEMLDKHLEKASDFVVVVDSDGDGYTSSALLVQYLRRLKPDIKLTYAMHDGRQNGLKPHIMEQIDQLKPNIVILPDASSNDYEQHKLLKSQGIDVIALDHHEIENGESEDAIIVSPQLSPDYDNKQISGAGVTYKFLKALDEKYELDWADDYLDLVALGNVTDAMIMTSPETRYLCYEGFKNIVNPFLKQLLFKNAGWSKVMYPKIISWDMAPKMNALIRVGSLEEKLDIFEAMIGEEREFYNTRTKRTETLVEKAVRLCTNAQAKQKRIRIKLIEEIKEKVELEGLNKNSFIVLKMDSFEKGLLGYIAGEVTKVFERPALLMIWNKEEDAYTGSLRGYGDVVDDMKQFLTELDLFNWLAGHSNAAGFSISKENVMKLDEAINEKLKDYKPSPIEVDFEIEAKVLSETLVEEFESYAKYWGKGVSEPVFLVKNMELRTGDINFKNIMKTQKNGLELMSFSINNDLLELSQTGDIAVCDVIGTIGVNRFLNTVTPQMIMEKIIIKEIKEDSFGGFVF